MCRRNIRGQLQELCRSPSGINCKDISGACSIHRKVSFQGYDQGILVTCIGVCIFSGPGPFARMWVPYTNIAFAVLKLLCFIVSREIRCHVELFVSLLGTKIGVRVPPP